MKLLFVKDKELHVFIHSITGLYPRDINLYRLAMAHRSQPVRTATGRKTNNERLEYLGDAVLNTVVADYLYHAYPRKLEGFLTSTRAKIVQRESLNRIGHQLRLDNHVHARTHTSSHNNYIYGNALEALVGAVYLDHGYKRCSRFIIKRLVEKYFNLDELTEKDRNYKSRLIEWTQKFKVSIEFELVDSYCDDDKNPVFKTAILLGGLSASEATGYSKKESHQNASKQALDRLHNDIDFTEQVLSTATLD